MEPGPPDLAPFLVGFVHRDDFQGGNVVRLLPEVRCSIQIMLADPLWLRAANSGACWVKVPRVSLWWPIVAYAVALTPGALKRLTGLPISAGVNSVQALSQFSAQLCEKLDPRPSESFDVWRARAIINLRAFFTASGPVEDALLQATTVLSTADGTVVANAAKAVGYSQRQFQRVFKGLYGVLPKHYQRAIRVDRMVRQMHLNAWEKDDFDGAITFADQPHAIREFRALTGMTPRQYVLAKRSNDATLRSVPVQGIAPPEAEQD
jgi:AraC-like DNA-binding protein